MGRMCGDCAKKSGMSLEQRIELALSGNEGEKYSCSVCFKVKEIPKIKGDRKAINKLVVESKRIKEKLTAVKKEMHPIRSDIEQLSFFDTTDHIMFK